MSITAVVDGLSLRLGRDTAARTRRVAFRMFAAVLATAGLTG